MSFPIDSRANGADHRESGIDIVDLESYGVLFSK